MKITKNKTKTLTTLFIIILFSIFLNGCQIEKKEAQAVTDNTFMMDTFIQMKAYGAEAREVIDASFKRMQEIEDEMSVSIKTSQIYKINSHPQKEIKIKKDTFKVIQKALAYAKLTEGKFDPSIRPLVELWGVDTENAHIPSNSEINKARKLVNYKEIKIDESKKTVRLTKKGMKLDLGAIAKGYAADEVRKIIESKGVESAYVNLGGNVLVIGSKPDGSAWKVGIQNPRLSKSGVIASIEVRDKTIVTSGNYERYFKENGIIYHHIIDPTTGRPARTGIISTSIITRNSFDADALSTSVFILGPKKGLKLIESMPDVETMIITTNLNIILSSGLKNRVKILNPNFQNYKR